MTTTLLALTLALSLLLPVSPRDVRYAATSQAGQSYQVLFSVAAGANGVQYSPKREEELQWGPTALAVAPDGSFVIANTVSNNLLHLSPTGTLLNTINLSGKATGISDIKATAAGIYALDAAAPVPAVLHLTYLGQVLSRHEVPAEMRDLLTGLALGSAGELLIEQQGHITHRLLDHTGKLASLPVRGLSIGTTVVQVQQATRWSPSRGSIYVGATTVDVSVPNELGGIRLLGAAGAAGFYASVDDLTTDSDGAFRVDEVVHHYGPDGRLLGKSRFPLAQQLTPVGQPFAVARDGSVYALLTRPDGVQVARLTFSTALSPAVPVQRERPGSPLSAPQASTACTISRSGIEANAWAYINNSKLLPPSATDGYCPGRGKPRYIGGSGTYPSVSYDWGGWDSVGDFNRYIDGGYQAGDIHTAYMEGCSRGVDCSGFVTRAWGRTDLKYSTRMLPNISTPIGSRWDIRQGDILNWPGVHVTLVDYINGNGASVWESTTAGRNDRAIYRFLPWSAFNNFQPRRYNGACDTDTADTSPPVVKAPAQSFVTGSQLGTARVPVRIAWSGADSDSGIGRYQLQKSINSGAYVNVTLPKATATTATVLLAPGYTYRFRVMANDGAGNPSSWAYGPTFTAAVHETSDPMIAYTGVWTRETSSGASGGYVRYSIQTGASATLLFTGRNVAWIAPKSSVRGKADVYVDGAYVATIDLYSATTRPRTVLYTRSWASPGTHTLQVQVLGTLGRPRVDVDAFTVLR